MDRIVIDQDIRKASTLPSDVYHDPLIYEQVVSRVLAPSWQFLGGRGLDRGNMEGDSSRPLTFLPGSVDEPLVLTRSGDDWHLLSNVCTHRGNLVCWKEENESHLRCRYHGRRWSLDGKFSFMPEFEDVLDFPSEKDHLQSTRLETWGPLQFGALNPELELDEIIGPMKDLMGWLPLDQFEFDSKSSSLYSVSANWALYCDNYLEGFHIPYIHPGLAPTLEYSTYETVTFDWMNVQIGEAPESEPAFDLPADHPHYGRRIAGYYFWIYPNMMFNFYPWGLSVNIVRPLGVDRTEIEFLSYVRDDSLRHGAGGPLHEVELEDEEVVEATMKGVRSRLYHRGRYSPMREKGVHHFHLLLSAALNG